MAENPWYTSIPTVLPNTKDENDMIGGYTDLSEKFSSSKGKSNIFVSLIAGNCTESGFDSAADAAATVASAMSGAQYLELKQDAFDRLLAYYETLN